VVHRDLKPENLLYESMTDDSKLKIADFGLSRIIEPEVQMSTVCGTPGYCAPEVLLGQKYTHTVDLWSVGVIAYILLCGYEPFFSDNEPEMFKKIIKGDYVFDSPYWDDISENAKDLVRKLLKVDPTKRIIASEALKHPWVKGGAAKDDHMETTMEKIKIFNARRKLKCVTDAMLAIAKATTDIPFSTFVQQQDETEEPSKGDEQEAEQTTGGPQIVVESED